MPRRSFRRSSGVRRKSRWESTYAGVPLNSNVPVPTVALSSSVHCVWARVPAATYDNINGFIVEDDCTVYRMFNTASFGITVTTDCSMDFTVGMGIIGWDSIDDVPPAVVDTPFPVQSGGFDWLWRWTSSFQQLSGAGDVITAQNNYGPELFVQSKAMRKLSAGTGLLLVAELFAHVDNMDATYGWSQNGRYALKLP